MTLTTNPVNALEAALEAAAKGDMVGSLLDPRDLAQFVVETLTTLGVAMPDEAAKLQATAAEHAECAARLGESWAYGDGLEVARDGLKGAIADVLALCREAETVTGYQRNSGTCRAWTLDPARVEAALTRKAGGRG